MARTKKSMRALRAAANQRAAKDFKRRGQSRLKRVTTILKCGPTPHTDEDVVKNVAELTALFKAQEVKHVGVDVNKEGIEIHAYLVIGPSVPEMKGSICEHLYTVKGALLKSHPLKWPQEALKEGVLEGTSSDFKALLRIPV